MSKIKNTKIFRLLNLLVCSFSLIIAVPLYAEVVASKAYLPKVGKSGYALIEDGKNFINPCFYVEWTASNGDKGVYALLKYEKSAGKVRMRDKKGKIHRFNISNFSEESRGIIGAFEEIMAKGKMTYINSLDFWAPWDCAVELSNIYKDVSSEPQHGVRFNVKFPLKGGALCRMGHKIPYTNTIIYDKDLFFLYWHSPQQLKVNDKFKVSIYKCGQYAFITDENKLMTVDAYTDVPYFSMIDSYIKKHPQEDSKFYDAQSDKPIEDNIASIRPSERDLAAFNTSQARITAKNLYAYSAKKKAEEEERIEQENRKKEKEIAKANRARIARERRAREREEELQRQRDMMAAAAAWSNQRDRESEILRMSNMEMEMQNRMDEMERRQQAAVREQQQRMDELEFKQRQAELEQWEQQQERQREQFNRWSMGGSL